MKEVRGRGEEGREKGEEGERGIRNKHCRKKLIFCYHFIEPLKNIDDELIKAVSKNYYYYYF